MSPKFVTKEDVLFYLKELAKEYRKLGGKHTPGEIIIVGGSSIMLNYLFRHETEDIDAYFLTSSAIKQAAHNIADQYNLPHDWINDDFKYTESYTPKIIQYSKYLCTFSNVLTIRTITAEYLIAMKLRAYRLYKHDLSDIYGILFEEQHNITSNSIKQAVIDLYGALSVLSQEALELLQNVSEIEISFANYQEARNSELNNKRLLNNFNIEYPGQIDQNNVEQILEILKNKRRNSGQDK